MPHVKSLQQRVDELRQQAIALQARVTDDALRARLDDALAELDRIPQIFPERLAIHALLVPAGRIQTVLDIVSSSSNDTPGLRR
jgi:hypothetical protein